MADHFVVRVKYRNGFVDVADGNVGRLRMIPFDAGNAETSAQATAIGQAVLTQYGFSPKRSTKVTVGDTPTWPMNGDAISTFDIGGSLTTQRLLARRVELGQNGEVRLDPTLNHPSDEYITRQSVAIRRMTNGTVGGRTSGSNPFQQVNSGVITGQMQSRRLETWSWSPITVVDGPIWEVNDYVLATKGIATLSNAVADAIRFDIYVNGIGQTFINVPAGQTDWVITGNLQLVPGDKMQVNCAEINTLTEFDLDDCRATVQFVGAPNDLRREPAASAR